MPAQPPDLQDSGWFVEKLVSTLSFGDRAAFLLEDWSIVADIPLGKVLIELNLDPEQAPSVDVLGAELIPGAVPQSVSGRRFIAIRLPSRLGPQEPHTFQLQVPVPGADRIGHHLCKPVVHCRRLDVRVHFDRSAVPARVRAINGRRTQAADSGPQHEVPVNIVGEVEIGFEHPVLGRPYGLAW
ncbi:MAG TPA: hypothetical protein VLL08_30170 [Kineosporiaceae bacterium]|nr:hypothetical protein [Kineosporiaceae bacterium]